MLIKISAVVLLALFVHTLVFAGTIGPDLVQVLERSEAEDRINVIIELSDKLDVKRLKRKGKKHRKEIVREFKNKSRSSKVSIKRILKQSGIKISKDLWLTNSIAVNLPAKMISKLASRPRIKIIKLDAKIILSAIPTGDPGIPEWNLDAVNVTALWSQGITGQGVVVGSMDTGVDVDHQDLTTRWRAGTNSWFDPYGEHATPYDAVGHGTQTTSIMVGGNADGTVIGMAPDAQWIAAKIFDDAGTATFSSIHAAFQWMLDPDGNPDTDDAADVVNNSWNLETTLNQCNSEFQTDIDSLRAAGIAVVFSAGNSGPNPATSLSPANNNGSLATGAIDESLNVEFYSSRGPSACDGGIFPQISAPGASIYVADLTFGGIIPNSYTFATGTSFASAHVAGALALLESGVPASTLADREVAIQQSAVDAGTIGDDNEFGWGILDVGAAYAILAGAAPTTSSLQFSLNSVDIAENGTSLTIEVVRVGDTAGSVTVDYNTMDGTATAGFDYTATNGTLVFADGVVSQSFNVAILDDTSYESNENFIVALGNVIGGSLGSPNNSTVTILENESAPPAGTVQFSGANLNVAENASGVSITVIRTGGSFGTVTVDYSTSNGTAIGGIDYTNSSGTLSFTEGVTTVSVNVPIIDDTNYEGDESFSVTLANVTGGSLGSPSNATIAIIDDDPLPPAGSVQFGNIDYSVVENAGSVTVIVNRVGGSYGTVTVDYSTLGSSAIGGTDYITTTGTLSFVDGVTTASINIPIMDDALVEGNENFSINLTNVTGGSLGSPGSATLIITDDDAVPPPPPVILDNDGDGFEQDLDCNDNDASIYPGATEIKSDGVDQDCNGYDLTIVFKKAVYKTERERLIVRVISNMGSNANLSLVGYGAMNWNSRKGYWAKTIKNLTASPTTVTVSGVEGSETTTVVLD